MKKLTIQESSYIIDRLMELMDTEVGKKYTDELLIAMLCIQINELEGKLATEREMAKMSSLCDNCATVGCIFQAGIEREKCAFYKNKDNLFCKSQLTVEAEPTQAEKCEDCIHNGANKDKITCKKCALVETEAAQGEWIKTVDGNGWNDWWVFKCPFCGATIEDKQYRSWEYNFCPNCGARMKGADDEID